MEDHVCPRRPIDFNAHPRFNALHVYGVDFWTHEEVKQLFNKAAGQHKIEWLDDSSLNIVFQTEEQKMKAVRCLVAPPGAHSHKGGGKKKESASNEANERLLPLDNRWQTMNKDKVSALVPKKQGRAASCLEFRSCTTSDQKDESHDGSKSVFYQYQMAEEERARQRGRTKRDKKRMRLLKHEEQKKMNNNNNNNSNGAAGRSTSNERTYGASRETKLINQECSSSSGSDDDEGDKSGKWFGTGMERRGPPYAQKPLQKTTTSSSSLAAASSGGLFDPLLFMRANQGSSTAGGANQESSSVSGHAAPDAQMTPREDALPVGDLATLVQQAEAQSSIVIPAPAPASTCNLPTQSNLQSSLPPPPQDERKRQRPRREDKKSHGEGRNSVLTQESDGKSSKGGASGGKKGGKKGKGKGKGHGEKGSQGQHHKPQPPRILTSVHKFLLQHEVRHKRHIVTRTFLSITFGRSKEQKKKEGAEAQAKKAHGPPPSEGEGGDGDVTTVLGTKRRTSIVSSEAAESRDEDMGMRVVEERHGGDEEEQVSSSRALETSKEDTTCKRKEEIPESHDDVIMAPPEGEKNQPLVGGGGTSSTSITTTDTAATPAVSSTAGVPASQYTSTSPCTSTPSHLALRLGVNDENTNILPEMPETTATAASSLEDNETVASTNAPSSISVVSTSSSIATSASTFTIIATEGITPLLPHAPGTTTTRAHLLTGPTTTTTNGIPSAMNVPTTNGGSGSSGASDAASTTTRAATTVEKGKSPWDEYIEVNKVHHSQLLHCVLWTYGERQYVVAVVPHPTMVNTERLAKAMQIEDMSTSKLRICKLKDVQRYTGGPLFVCPVFGIQCPILVDASIVDESSKPLYFDLGDAGISMESSEFLRSTKAACVEGLGKMP